jgi:hypothetical protein
MGAIWNLVAFEGAGLISRASEEADSISPFTEGAGSGYIFEFRTNT